MRIKTMLYGSILALLAGCSTLSTTPPLPPKATDTIAAWALHKKDLETLSNWQFSGRLAVKTGNSEPYQSVRIQWDNQPLLYRVYLTDPLGRSVGRLEVQPDKAQLTLPKSPLLVAHNPDALIHQALGLNVPISSLRHWVLGLPNPHAGKVIRLNDQGFLGDLYQDNWQIHYERYAFFSQHWLPTKITVQNVSKHHSIILLISQWDISA